MISRITLFTTVLALATPSVAQQADWTVDGTIGVVSDYRYRGYSLSDEQPALQGGLTLSHQTGFYGDVFVSTIDEYGVGADGDGAEVEVTATIGWTGALLGLDVDAAVAAYQYPDGDEVNYVEIPVQVGQTLGDISWTLGLAYAPDQEALGEEDNRYGWAGLTYAPETWPISLTGSVGYEDGAFAPEGKTDWSLGGARDFGPVTLALTWIDSDEYEGQAVASAFLNF